MKKTIFSLLILTVALSCLAACGNAGGGAEAGDVDLPGFYDKLAADYELPEMMEMSDDTLESCYPGLKDISLKQSVVKIPMMTSVVSEFVFVECENSADVAAVEEILQARIDTQASGGAWYPMSMEAWAMAEVVTNGNYVAMIAAGEDTASIVSEWNALFE